MDLSYEFSVLQDMMERFDQWFPFDGDEDEEERNMYREGFSRLLDERDKNREDLLLVRR